MYCSLCGKFIKQEKEWGYCPECKCYTQAPSPFVPDKTLKESSGFLFLIVSFLALILKQLGDDYKVYELTAFDFKTSVIFYLAWLPVIAMSVLICVIEYKRKVSLYGFSIYGYCLLYFNVPFLVLCYNIYQNFFQ